jgi:hypothetical protein
MLSWMRQEGVRVMPRHALRTGPQGTWLGQMRRAETTPRASVRLRLQGLWVWRRRTVLGGASQTKYCSPAFRAARTLLAKRHADREPAQEWAIAAHVEALVRSRREALGPLAHKYPAAAPNPQVRDQSLRR